MKRNLLALAISAAAASNAMADASVYGQIDLSVQQLDATKATTSAATYDALKDDWEVLSNASRLGFKGDSSINDDLKVIYKLEYEVSPDGDSSSSSDCKNNAGGSIADGCKVSYNNEFRSRNMYIGLQSESYGTVLAGKHDTPTKLAQNKIDQFNDLTYGDMKYVLVGENRVNDIVMYTTPEFSGFSATVALAPGEQSDDDNTGTVEDKNDGLADHVSAAVQYQAGNFYAAIAGDQDIEQTDVLRGVVQYTVGDLQLGALYQTAEDADKKDNNATEKKYLGKTEGVIKEVDGIAGYNLEQQDGYLLSAAYKLGDFTLKAQYAASTTESYTPATSDQDIDATLMAVGVDYKLAKSTKVYTYYAANDTDVDALNDAGGNEPDADTFGVGIQHKF